MTAIRWEPLRLPAPARVALYRFRWRMRHPREGWPGFAAAVAGELLAMADRFAESANASAAAFGRAAEVARGFACMLASHATIQSMVEQALAREDS